MRLTIAEFRMGFADWNWAFGDYGPRLKEYRRIFHHLLSPKQIPQYRPVIEEELHLFLQRLLSNPGDFADHVRTYVSGSPLPADF
jgi:cytochrome P450